MDENVVNYPHPGIMLGEFLLEEGVSQADLARRMGRPPQVINEIIRGKTRITPSTALELEICTGIPAETWSNAMYAHNLARARAGRTFKARPNVATSRRSS